VATALHIIDADVSADALRQLAALRDKGDPVASLGPVELPAEPTWPVVPIHKPLGCASAAGLMAPRLSETVERVHAWSISAALAGEAIARRQGCGLIVHLPHFPPSRLGRLIMVTSWEQAAVTVPTDSCRRRLVAAGLDPKSIHVLPPVGSAIKDRQALRARTRRALALDNSHRLLVAPGALTRQAGHKYACWVFAVLRHVRDDVRLLVPADGPARRSVQYFVSTLPYQEEVSMPAGRVSAAEALAAADLAVFLPAGDCAMVALAEAMGAGLPIVAWDTADVEELTGGGRAAVVCPPRDVRGASAEILRLLEDSAAAKKLAAAAGTWARQHFSVAAVKAVLEGIGAVRPRVAPA
jgi:glycosyltransferase involved in cell wall biosynthesis